MASNDMKYRQLYEQIYQEVLDYLDFIKEITFAEVECEIFQAKPTTPEELADYVGKIIDTAKSLNRILEQSPASIYVTDANGETLRVNKAFEEEAKIDREMLIGKSTIDCENEKIYYPSAVRLALQEKKRVIVRQNNVTNRQFVVTGVPVYDEQGNIVNVVTNALRIEEIKNIVQYLKRSDSPEAFSKDEKMIAISSQMKSIIQLADLIKDTSSTVMIDGETGVGKNVLARYIHYSSNRKDKRMLEVNCGAIPGALLESELFGYAGGAFTGAKEKGKPGLIDMCRGGTLLLDEISELPLSLQVKILHFLQNKKFIRVGGVKEVDADVRVIAVTNKNLEAMVQKGDFREDLYYRLNVVPIVIPPLRERKEELIPFAQHFVEKYSRIYGKMISLTEQDIEEIKKRKWSGNVRELENYIERFVVTEGRANIVDDVLSISKARDDLNYDTTGVEDDSNEEKVKMLKLYDQYRSSYKVAKEMGMSQSTAYRRLKKYLSE